MDSNTVLFFYGTPNSLFLSFHLALVCCQVRIRKKHWTEWDLDPGYVENYLLLMTFLRFRFVGVNAAWWR